MDDRELATPDAAHLAQTLERVHDADVADALNAIDPPAAARVLAALPLDLAVRTLQRPPRSAAFSLLRR
jgi:Mg/Co/Ni transporter MgtE